jgi:hypothetical protein
MSGSFASSVSPGSASIAFTDGDTARRVTISDANVTSTSRIVGQVIRPATSDLVDPGYVYTHSIISVTNGGFDVIVVATVLGDSFIDLNVPNETVTFSYFVR